MGEQLGITPEQIDKLFKYANGEIVDGEFTTNYDAATKLEDVTQQYKGKYNVPEDAVENYAYKITLREDLKWHDGTPIDADDFVYTMQELCLWKNPVSLQKVKSG